MSKKIVHIGIEGLRQNLIKEWIDELPNFDKLIGCGIWGTLKGTIPASNAAAWASLMSGKNPGNFGFWDGTFRSEYSYGEPNLADSSVLNSRVNTVYTLLQKNGLKVAVIDVPLSFPASSANGYFISSDDGISNNNNFTNTPELKDEIEGLVGEYILKIDGSGITEGNSEQLIEKVKAMDGQRFELVEYFTDKKKCDYVIAVVSSIERISEVFTSQDADNYKKILKECYKFYDDRLGRIIDIVDDDTIVIVSSNRSAHVPGAIFNINEWLINEGYLKLNTYPNEPMKLMDCQVDWNNTRAWAAGSSGKIYLNVRTREKSGIVHPRDYASAVSELSHKLLSVTNSINQDSKSLVFKRADMHSGQYSKYGPDCFIDFNDGCTGISEKVGYDKGEFFTSSKKEGHKCTYQPKGFYLIVGSIVPAMGEQIKDILDVAPTILSILEVNDATSMEGKPIFSGDPNSMGSDEDDEIKKRLEALGYLG